MTTSGEQPDATPSSRNDQPGCRSRALAIFIGLIYCVGFTTTVAGLTRVPFGTALFFVVLGMMAVMVAITLLCYRWFLRTDSKIQFDLASIFLIMVPFAVFFAGIRSIVQTFHPTSLSVSDWLVVVISSVLFISMSTLILLWLAEALVGLSLQVVQCLAGIQRRSRITDKRDKS